MSFFLNQTLQVYICINQKGGLLYSIIILWGKLRLKKSVTNLKILWSFFSVLSPLASR